MCSRKIKYTHQVYVVIPSDFLHAAADEVEAEETANGLLDAAENDYYGDRSPMRAMNKRGPNSLLLPIIDNDAGFESQVQQPQPQQQEFGLGSHIFNRRGRLDVKKPGPFYPNSANNFFLDKVVTWQRHATSSYPV